MKINSGKIIFNFFLIFGFFACVFGIWILSEFYIKETDRVFVTAKIIDIETYRENHSTHRRILVQYYVDNSLYESKIEYYIDGMQVGDEIEIFYSAAKGPDFARAEILSYDDVFCFIIGFIFIVVGTIGKIIFSIKEKKSRDILEKGYCVYADFDRVDINKSAEYKGNSPYVIICKWKNPRDNKEYLFESDDFLFDPTKCIESKSITRFKVCMSLDNEKDYVVDTSMIEKI